MATESAIPRAAGYEDRVAADNARAADKLNEAGVMLRQALDVAQEAASLFRTTRDIAQASRLVATIADGISGIQDVPILREQQERLRALVATRAS